MTEPRIEVHLAAVRTQPTLYANDASAWVRIRINGEWTEEIPLANGEVKVVRGETGGEEGSTPPA